MSRLSAITRIPRPELPNPLVVFCCVFGLGLLGVVAYHPEQMPQQLLFPKKFTEALFLQNRSAMRATFVLSVIIHILEGVYAAYAMKRATRSARSLTNIRCIYWTVATVIFGFPSLTLLNKGIAKLHCGKLSKINKAS